MLVSFDCFQALNYWFDIDRRIEENKFFQTHDRIIGHPEIRMVHMRHQGVADPYSIN